jgi:hypothetical protein
MPLWGTYDNAANSDIGALMQVNASAGNTAARTLLFNNVTANTSVKSAKGAGNVVVGQFLANTAEIQAANALGRGHPPHSGWVLRHEGRGLKAGRVWYETLVAMASAKSDANNGEDVYFPDYALLIGTQPTSNTTNVPTNVTFTAVVTSVPAGAPLQYFWQYNPAPGGGWANVTNTAGQYFNNTSPTFTANNITANGNVFRVLVMTTGANNVYSSNASINKI